MKTVRDVVEAHLCVGCGACLPMCPQGRVSLVEYLEHGYRPVVADGDCGECRRCLDVCPGLGSDGPVWPPAERLELPRSEGHGPVLEIWEGFASDPEIRRRGSSGGALTALSLYGLERKDKAVSAVVHIGMDSGRPLKNRTYFSRGREEVLARVGSRYAPASVCDRLGDVCREAGKVVFVGQPLEVVALRKAQRLEPKLRDKVEVTLSFFCACSPSIRGTRLLLERHGIAPESVEQFHYRGGGWPGGFRVYRRGEANPCLEMTYADSWGFIQAYRPFSVHLWPDGVGEEADISCGDPWYQKPKAGDEGSSLIVVRSEAGRRYLAGAVEAGFLQVSRAEPWKLIASQKGLISKRGSVWGRLAAMRVLGMEAPRFPNHGLFGSWRRLPLSEKARSTFGTVRRILARGYRKPLRTDSLAEHHPHLLGPG